MTLSDTPENEFVPRRKLHRHSWLFVSIVHLKHFVVPLLAAFFLGAGRNGGLWPVLLILPMIAGALWHQWIYRYDFGPRGLVVRQGLLFRNVRNIDYRRIENIDTERNLLHRLLNVSEVRVETSSGGGSEAVIRVLDLAAVEEMRERVFSARNALAATTAITEPVSEEILLQLPPGELLRHGLIDNRGLVIVAAVFGLIAQAGQDRMMETWVEPLLQRLPIEGIATLGPLLQTLLLVSAIAGLIAGTRVLSVLFAFITLHGFRLTRVGDDFHVQHGLLTRISVTLRRPRIQVVHQKATLLHRCFGRVSLTVDLAGGLGKSQGQQNGNSSQARTLWLAPLCKPRAARRLVGIALPGVAGVSLHKLDWQGLAPRARWRLFRLLTFLWLAASIPLAAWLGDARAFVAIAAVIPLLWLHAHLYVRYTRWALHDNFFIYCRGWLTRRISIAPRNRIQSIRVSASPFDRRYGMASLAIDTAGAGTRRLRIPFLDDIKAGELAKALHASPANQ